MRTPITSAPVTIALVNDYDIVVMGIAHIVQQYRDRVVIAELDTNEAVSDRVDIVLYDSFAQPESDHDEIGVLIRNPRARRVAVYTWHFHPELIENARRQGVKGYLSKALPARDLVAALEAIQALPGPLIVVSDSTYVVNCFRDGWWRRWRNHGWTTTAKKPVANRDLWEPLVDLVEARGDIAFRWVKGHSGNRLNDPADELAVAAGLSQR